MKILLVILAVLFAAVPVFAEHPTDAPIVQEQADPTADSTTATPLEQDWEADGPSGNTMADFVAEAQTGWKRHFSDDDTFTLMRASRALKSSDKELSRKIEKIATKIANL